MKFVTLIDRSIPVDRRGLPAGLSAVGLGAVILSVFPALKLSFFSGAAARLASVFLGTPVVRIETGWMLPSHYEPVVVSAACSGTDFWLMALAMFAWQLARRGKSTSVAMAMALICATPFSIAVNALRVITVTHTHRWFIPLWPERYSAFFHQFTGVVVFLPALILLHVLLKNSRSQPVHRHA